MKYIPVQWNPNKWYYDAALLVGVVLFLWVFLCIAPGALSHERPTNPQIHNARAFGACAFTMLTVILCIGPLARLDRRFLPLLYNRRHFGVMTCAVAMTHAFYVLNWYFAFSGTDKYATVFEANTSYGQIAGFPFESLGIFALICLMILAATSHDFWLKFLSAPVWKSLHYLIYPAYAAVVGHVAFGVLQDQQNLTFAWMVGIGAGTVAALHIAAALKERFAGDYAGGGAEWIDICPTSAMTEGYAKIAKLPSGERVAVYLNEGKLSAISNACAHQNGPLGEGKIIDCLVTCPWHGFQYNVTNGQSPAPFTEKVPTYRVKVENGTVLVHRQANPPGTYVEPVPLVHLGGMA